MAHTDHAELSTNHTDEYSAAHAQVDIKDRVMRSLKQGLLFDILLAVLLSISTGVSSLEWSRAYWAALGLSIAKTFLVAAVAGLMRRYYPPAVL